MESFNCFLVWNGNRMTLTLRKVLANYGRVGVWNDDYKKEDGEESQPSENKVFKDKSASLVDFVCLWTSLFSPPF